MMFSYAKKAVRDSLKKVVDPLAIPGALADIRSEAASRACIEKLRSYPQASITTLMNGFRVATEPQGGETVTLGVNIDAGSRYEDARSNGVAHFLEHLLFKGTARRSRIDLEKEIENMGAQLNAYTSRETTCFNVKVLKKDVPQAVDLLSDMLQNSLLTTNSIERERDVILRESQEIDNNLHEVIFDRLHQTAYRGTALARTILGSNANICSITKADVDRYVKSHYVGPRMVLSATGAITHKEIVQLAEKHFGNVPSQPVNNVPAFKEPARFTGSDILVREDHMPLAHIAYAFETAGWNDPDQIPLLLIQAMLESWDKSVVGGKNSTSRLVSTIATRNLADSVTPFNTQYSDTGLFGVYVVAEQFGLHELMSVVTSEVTRFSYHVSEDQLDSAKMRLMHSVLQQLDGTSPSNEDLGRQVLTFGRRMHPIEMIQRINAVDVAAIKRCARRFLYDRDIAVAAVGPIYELPDYNFLRRRTYSLKY